MFACGCAPFNVYERASHVDWHEVARHYAARFNLCMWVHHGGVDLSFLCFWMPLITWRLGMEVHHWAKPRTFTQKYSALPDLLKNISYFME